MHRLRFTCGLVLLGCLVLAGCAERERQAAAARQAAARAAAQQKSAAEAAAAANATTAEAAAPVEVAAKGKSTATTEPAATKGKSAAPRANSEPVSLLDRSQQARPVADVSESVEVATPETAAVTTSTVMLGTPELTAGIPGDGPLTQDEIQSWLDDPRNHDVLDFTLPLGLSLGKDQVKGIKENPLTRAKIELGRQLYFDGRLSSDGSISCASCHSPESGWSKPTQFGEGINGQTGNRNSPISFNRILSDAQFWDGRAASLEEQAVGPIANPIEMGNKHETCVECLKAIDGYRMQFEKIFGELSIETVGKALATFERAVVTAPSPFDYQEELRPYLAADPEELQEADPDTYALYEEALAAAEAHPMSDSAKRGRELFFGDKAGCTACHVGANLSDEKFHNLGVGMDQPEPDLGRFMVTKEEKDKGAFKTPTIRNVAMSAPYMHDGSQKTLEEVVEWYAKGGHPNPHLDEKVKKLDLTAQEKQDLVEFMKACTGDFPLIETGRLPE